MEPISAASWLASGEPHNAFVMLHRALAASPPLLPAVLLATQVRPKHTSAVESDSCSAQRASEACSWHQEHQWCALHPVQLLDAPWCFHEKAPPADWCIVSESRWIFRQVQDPMQQLLHFILTVTSQCMRWDCTSKGRVHNMRCESSEASQRQRSPAIRQYSTVSAQLFI